MTEPKELLDETVEDIKPTEERATVAFKLEKKVKDLKYGVGQNFLEMGRLLKEIRDNQYYKDLGYDTVSEWLSSPDISINPRWAWDFISVHEIFVEKHGLAPASVLEADYSKLHDIIPIVRKDPDKVEEWLDKATNLRRVDLRREIDEYKGKDDKDIADGATAHVSVNRLLDWLRLLDFSTKEDNTTYLETLKEEIEGQIKKSTGLLDISELKK